MNLSHKLPLNREYVKNLRLPFYKFIGTAKVDGKVAASLKFAAAEMSYKK